ncbi:MAG: LysM peptidoglycan-binding domain-containing protein [Pseudomonadales bacterium]
MMSNKSICFNALRYIVKLIPILLLLTACSRLPPPDTIRPAAQTIDINHASAMQIIDGNPWNYFTDFGGHYACQLAEFQPEQHRPLWVEPETIWQRIRLGYQLDWQSPHRRINAEFNWYQKHPDYMARVSKRAERYIYYVTSEIEKRGLPLELALLPIVESAYDPFAYSHGRAAGMWQFIPSTGRIYKLDINWWYDGRRDVVASTQAAINYLEKLSQYYKGDWMLALAAYNSGQGNVNKAIRKNLKRGKPTDFWSLDLPRETRSYVPKLLALAKLVDNPPRYAVKLHPVANTPYFAQIDTQSQIDLAQAATMAGIEIDEMYRLNPGFNRWATSPTGPHRLLIPISQQATFESEVMQLPPEQRLHWQHYKVKVGDSLLLLAKRFNTGVDTIKQINGIRGNMIRAGQSLMIPTASQRGDHYSLSADQRLATIHKKRTGGANSQQLFHRIRSGESLWTIARRYNVRVSQLAHWNGMAPKDVLKPGQKLSVWTKSPSTVQAGQRDAVLRKVGYRVRNGDSLARIAGRFNLRVTDIVKWNAVNPKKYLQPGQQLTLYVDITNAVN